MAKKVVATLKTGTGKSDIVPNDQIKEFFDKK